MLRSAKRVVKQVLRGAGLEIRRINPNELGFDSMADIQRLTRQADRHARPLIFDVGANVGQSVERFREVFGRSEIHAFEPSPRAFDKLKESTAGLADVTINHCGLGARAEELVLMENEGTDMSSFLELGRDGWGGVHQRVKVPVRTVDDYCTAAGIKRIDILKSDTQGFDLEVLRGASRMISERRVHLVFVEITLCEIYRGMPGLDEFYRQFREWGFSLVSFYDFHYKNNRAGWTDALFVQDEEGLTQE